MAKAESDSGSARPVRVAVSTSFERDVHDPEAGVPIELGEVVTARLGGKAAVARILRGWTKKVTPAGTLSALDAWAVSAWFRKGQLPVVCVPVAEAPQKVHCLMEDFAARLLLMPACRRSRGTDGWSTWQLATVPTLSGTYSGRCRIERACCFE